MSSINIRRTNNNFVTEFHIGKYKLHLEDKFSFINPDSAELPVATAILLAMFERIDIEVYDDIFVEDGFLSSLTAVQNLLNQWSPNLNRVNVKSKTMHKQKDMSIVGMSFSGGVDSLYTFLKHKNSVSHLIFLKEFEPVSSKEESENAEIHLQRFASNFDKKLISIDYSARQFSSDTKISWRFLHGPVLAGLALSSYCSRFLISSSFNYRMLKPWGSHPLLDPLWSTDSTKIEHIGLEATRVQKTAAIASDPEIYRYLQVCWSSNAKNCGKCAKCVRTGITLHLLGVEEGPVPLKGIEQKVENWILEEDGAAEHAFHLMHLAREVGNRKLENLFSRKISSFVRKRALQDAGRELIGRHLARLLRPKRDWQSANVLLPDPSKFRD
ncbi:hypothetical protein [Sphingosinicella sp.]|uniref:hypothetical protein n=1 Tax=Sphingosinicella sp. TaxID=1917971 RepID=UPI00183CA7DB|nr:hypothetical protein [Sphingosinicella sp.]MBA4758410.1 hypothetical protein [Sphingosinicella sp.]